MSDLVKLTAGTMAGGFVALVAFAWFMLFIGYPLLVFSIVRTLKGIRSELVELNETISRKLPM